MSVHHNFRKGQQVLIIFRDGSKVVDKFLEKKGGCGVYYKSGKLKGSILRQVVILKDSIDGRAMAT